MMKMLKRSSTNWSFFSKWSWNWFRIFVLKRIDFSSTFVSRLLDSFWFRSGLCVRLSRLNSGSVIRIRIWYCIEYRIEHRASYLDLFTQHEPKQSLEIKITHLDLHCYRSSLSYFTLHWLGNRINILKYFLMWSQITFLSSIRLTGSRQIDF